MKNITIILLLLTISCIKKQDSDTNKISTLLDYPRAIIKTDTLKIGEIYSATIYLQNSTLNVKNREEITMKYSLNESAPWIVLEKGIPIPVKSDSGYLAFKVPDDSIKQNELKKGSWMATLTYPVENKDTTFAIKVDYYYYK